MARRRNDINYAKAGCGCLILLFIFFLILKKVFIFLKPYLMVAYNFITDPIVIKIFLITNGVMCLVAITVVIIHFVIKYLKEKQQKKEDAERKRLEVIKAEEEKKAEEERRGLAEKKAEEEKKIEEERKRVAAIRAEKERQSAIEQERLRLEREYQYGYRDDMTGYEYEEYCADLFRCFNWKTEVTKKSGDYGVDVIAKKKGITIVAQCKKYTNQKVGFDAVKEVFTAKALYNADFAIVITNSEFAKSAIKGAKGTHVQLLRHPDLGDWLIKLFPEDEKLKVKKKNIKTLKEWIKYYNVKLLPYENVFKMIRGDDYDLYKATFELWKKTKTNSDEWMFKFVNELDEIFSFLDKKSFDKKEINEASEKVNNLLPIGNKKEIEDDEVKKKPMSLSEWTEVYKEQLSPYVEIMKITEGDSFDLFNESYNAWKDTEVNSEIWLDYFIKSLQKTLSELAEQLEVSIDELGDTIQNNYDYVKEKLNLLD